MNSLIIIRTFYFSFSAPRRGVSAFTPKLSFQQNVSPIPDLRPSLDHHQGGGNKPAFVNVTNAGGSGGGRRSRYNSGNSTNGGGADYSLANGPLRALSCPVALFSPSLSLSLLFLFYCSLVLRLWWKVLHYQICW